MTETAPDFAVEIRGLQKTYPARGGGQEKRALDGIDLAIPRGSLFGLLGPNGAGKSTLINILSGLVIKSAGTARIWDADLDAHPRRAKRRIGVVPQELNIDPFFTPRALLDLQAGLYGVPKAQRRTEELLEAMGLSDKAEAYARSLSGGMRRRLMVAKAMVHAPPVLVLDEPTAGVDVALRQQLWSYVRDLNQAGVTVLLTTHYLQEAEELCDRIAIINNGRLIACDDRDAILSHVDGKEATLQFTASLTEIPEPLRRFTPEMVGPERLLFRYRRSASPMAEILAACAAAGLTVADISTREASLEDVFLRLTGGA